MESLSLIYFKSEYIYNFLVDHPLHENTWTDEKKELAKRGGLGDQAGLPPTPSVHEFLRLIHLKKDLFDQKEFWDHCYYTWWHQFLKNKSRGQVMGLRAKAYRNFYPSMIDSLHVWSLLAESGYFVSCHLDSYEDVVGKSDISVKSFSGHIYSIGLRADTVNSQSCFYHKTKHRDVDGKGKSVISVTLPVRSREIGKQTGNKRWYQLSDFDKLFKIESELNCDDISQ